MEKVIEDVGGMIEEAIGQGLDGDRLELLMQPATRRLLGEELAQAFPQLRLSESRDIAAGTLYLQEQAK